MEDSNGDVNREKDAVLGDIRAALSCAEDLAKVPGMLEEIQRKQESTGAALSEHISMHCAQLRTGLEDMAKAFEQADAIKGRLMEIQELCKRSDVLRPTEARHANILAVVQANLKRTIGGVENIYKFPAKATDALEMLREVDTDHTALFEIGDISKVEAYFGRVQQANNQFTAKLLSYFDNVAESAEATPHHLMTALRIILSQDQVWGTLRETAESNPWGIVYKDEATKRMQNGVAKHLKPICHEAERVFAKWMKTHGRTAPVLFQQAAESLAGQLARNSGSGSPPSSVNGSSDPGHQVSSSGGNARMSTSASEAAAAVIRGTSAVAARLIGGVGHVPIKLKSMTEPVNSAPEAVGWLQTVDTNEEAMESMNKTLVDADEVRWL